jgi:hypothetical protein
METRKLPIGADDFKSLITDGYYYIDKTSWITALLRTHGVVNLFTRPRRFGKTLNMTMLKEFLQLDGDVSLFNGLDISKEKKLCEEHKGKYPVIFLTLMSIDAASFDDAYKKLCNLIANEFSRYSYLRDDIIYIRDENGDSVPEKIEDRAFLRILLSKGDKADIEDSLRILSSALNRHYNKKCIVLIDEYDVPLDKAFRNDYYDQMIEVIRGLLGSVLKTNPNLNFAVLTGALRISKESIFTGLNNFDVNSVTSPGFGEYFGFTDDEVAKLLADYGLQSRAEDVKAWYDGYHIGGVDVYCPWDVINYVKSQTMSATSQPKAYWANTSGNDLVRRFIDKADARTRNDIERLVCGESVVKKVKEELTYREIDENIDNLWSVLFMTGYLTSTENELDMFKLIIPNLEIKKLFIDDISTWFTEKVRKQPQLAEELSAAFYSGDTDRAEKLLNSFLVSSISYHDYDGELNEKEGFYHALMLALLTAGSDWAVYSNEESGDGRADMLIESADLKLGIVMEFKYADSIPSLESACTDAMDQIEEKRYATRLWFDGVEQGLAYGIAFCKKRCKVIVKKLT